MRSKLFIAFGCILIISLLGMLFVGCAGKQNEAMNQTTQDQVESQEQEPNQAEEETEEEADASSSSDFSEWKPFE